MVYKQQKEKLMTNKEKIMKLLSTQDYVTYKEVKGLKIPTIELTRLTSAGLLERVAKGVYVNPNILDDEFYIAHIKYKHLVYCKTTALYLNNMANRTLYEIEANVPYHYNHKISGIKIYRVNAAIYETGKDWVLTPFGNKVYAYDKERCICDLFLFSEHDNEAVRYAINAYKQSGIDYEKLYSYAKRLGVFDKVFSLFEVI